MSEAEGYLADENLTVDYLQVQSSTQQFASLRDGEYDLIITSPDNVVHYRLNESNAIGGTFDTQAIAGVNRGQNLVLMVQPWIESYEDLRGGSLAVDSPYSGFAFVLYEMMRQHGLERHEDYELVEAGGSFARYQGIVNGDFDGTLLLSGWELRAEAEGAVIFDSAVDTVPDYLGQVVAGRQGWISENADPVQRLLRAYHRANEWIFDPANREAAIVLLAEQSGVDEEIAERMYEVQVNPAIGIIPDQRFGASEMRTVLELRQEYGGFDEPQDLDYLVTPEAGLWDIAYLDNALAQ